MNEEYKLPQATLGLIIKGDDVDLMKLREDLKELLEEHNCYIKYQRQCYSHLFITYYAPITAREGR